MPDTSDDLVLTPSMIDALQHAKPISSIADRTVERGVATPAETILRSVALGAVAGMRSMMPLALLSAAAQSPQTPIARALARLGPLAHLSSRAAFVGFGLAALGELVADKLPFVPARISPLPLLGRVAIGALSGVVVTLGCGGTSVRGVRRGAAAALLASFAGYFARTRLSRRTPIPDPVWALAEDALALGIGSAALFPSLAQTVRSLTSGETP